MKAWDYIIDRVEEARSTAQTEGDREAEDDIYNRWLRIKEHRPSETPAGNAPTCVNDGSPFPCRAVKHEARIWKERADFPTSLY